MKHHSFLKKSLLVAVGGVSLLLLQQPSNAWEGHCGWHRGFYYGECEHYPQPSSHYHHPESEPAPTHPTQQPIISICIAIVGCN